MWSEAEARLIVVRYILTIETDPRLIKEYRGEERKLKKILGR